MQAKNDSKSKPVIKTLRYAGQDLIGEKDIKCPYCGCVYDLEKDPLSRQEQLLVYGNCSVICENCVQVYGVSKHTIVTYKVTK